MLKTIFQTKRIAQTRCYHSDQIFRAVPLLQQGSDIKLRGRFDNLTNSLSQPSPLSLTRPYLAGSEAASLPELLQYATDQDCLALQLDKVTAWLENTDLYSEIQCGPLSLVEAQRGSALIGRANMP